MPGVQRQEGMGKSQTSSAPSHRRLGKLRGDGLVFAALLCFRQTKHQAAQLASILWPLVQLRM